jgi:hypothetical protein
MTEEEPPASKRRICVDLERCILAGDLVDSDPDNVQIVPRTVALVQKLTLRGDHVIIHSCAPGSSARQIESILRSHRVPFDEIVCNRVPADISVHRSATHPFCAESLQLPLVDGECGSCSDDNGFVRSRSFNFIETAGDNVVVKSSSATPIRGELFFYFHLPFDVAHLFPTIVAEPQPLDPLLHADPPTSTTSSLSESDDGLVEEQALTQSCMEFQRRCRAPLVSIRMTRVKGPTFSHLLTSRCLTSGRFERLLGSLLQLHNSDGSGRLCKCGAGAITSIYDNYSRKLQARVAQHTKVYDDLQHILSKDHLDTLLRHLAEYEADDRGVAVNVLHGDPVFSNVLSERDGGIKFVDMRGMQGDKKYTLAGDAAYDLAKCWQSLSGYDYIMRDRDAGVKDAGICLELQATFRRHMSTCYPGMKYRDIVLIASSLYATLIPLHDFQGHRIAFARRAVTFLQTVVESCARGETDLLDTETPSDLQYSSDAIQL